MADIVVCYSRKDQAKTAKLVEELERRGYAIWWDPKIKATDPNYIAVIFRELAAARAVIVVWTTESLKSNNVIGEAKWALDQGILVPVIDELQPDRLPPPFNIAGNVVPLADRPAIIAELYKIQVIPQQIAGDEASSTIAPRADYTLEDVFRTDVPTVTMIDRSNEQEFKLFRSELRQPGRVLRIYGPSKSGKTVFARQALTGLHPIEMEGAQIGTLDHFYRKLNDAFPLNREEANRSVGDRLRQSRRPIIIDDFHRIPKNAQREIIMDAKGYLASGINFILVSVPDCAKSIVEDDNDFLLRTKAVRPPRWRADKLLKIAKTGFAALNVELDERSLRAIISEAFNNPFLVQHYCRAVCAKKKVFSTVKAGGHTLACEKKEIEEIVTSTASEVASYFEKRVQLDGNVRLTLLSGRSITLQGLILASLTDVEITQDVGMVTIMRKVKKLTNKSEQSSINQTVILQASEALITQLQGQSPSDLTMGMNGKCLHILHPFFKVYLKWKLVPKLTGQPAKLVDWE